jgi:hypothetical protein
MLQVFDPMRFLIGEVIEPNCQGDRLQSQTLDGARPLPRRRPAVHVQQRPERELRTLALSRNNWTFAGSDEGGRRAAAIYTLIQTAKLNRIDPEAWLADILARLSDHPARRIADLLPWNWAREHIAPQARLMQPHRASRDVGKPPQALGAMLLVGRDLARQW